MQDMSFGIHHAGKVNAMKKSRYTETQIIKVLKEVEGGRPVKEVCRGHGISDATHYYWKAKHGGMEASDVKCLKELKDEKRLPRRHPDSLAVPTVANHCWSMDFKSDSLFRGRRFRTINVANDFHQKVRPSRST